MHIHILGICGTFMGGIAAIARQAGHLRDRLRRQRLSADERPSCARLGIRPHRRASTPAQLDPGAGCMCVVGNVVTRGNPLIEAHPRRAASPTSRARSGSPSTVLAGASWVLAVAGTHGKTTTSRCWRGSSRHAGRSNRAS
jgi:UDP-N-acetylmuramate: L-alanyl-gamma-D-glutamyl-meso-diaminopimelate ligase